MTKHAAADFKQVQQQKKKQEAHHAGKLMMKAASTVASSSSSSQLQLHTSSSTRDSLSSPPEIVLDSSANLATSKYLDSRNHGGDDWEELEEGLKSLDSSSPSFFSGGGGAGASFDTRASSKLLLSSETSSIQLSPNLQNHHHHVAAAAFHMRDKPFTLGSDGSQILAALDAPDPDDDDDDEVLCKLPATFSHARMLFVQAHFMLISLILRLCKTNVGCSSLSVAAAVAHEEEN
jgi:hypothetical protein